MLTNTVESANCEAKKADGSQTQRSVELAKNARERGNILHHVYSGRLQTGGVGGHSQVMDLLHVTGKSSKEALE